MNDSPEKIWIDQARRKGREAGLREAVEICRERSKACEAEHKREVKDGLDVKVGNSCRLEAELIERKILALIDKETD